MICSESLNHWPDGTLFLDRHPKNRASQLHVASATQYFPIFKEIEI